MFIAGAQKDNLLLIFVPTDDGDENAAWVAIFAIEVLAVFMNEHPRQQARLRASRTTPRLPVAERIGSC